MRVEMIDNVCLQEYISLNITVKKIVIDKKQHNLTKDELISITFIKVQK